ncbi:Gfo/Idh/MocA family oxidoreductase [Planctomycetota bacterium]
MRKKNSISRRDFIKSTAVVSTAAMLSGTEKLFAAGSDKIRVGIIGSGGRGTGAAWNCVQSVPNIEVYALADLFQDKIDRTLDKYRNEDPEEASAYSGGRLKDEQLNVTPERCFVGFDAYKKLLATDVDLVVLACPPHFRPGHLAAAVEAGKHVFMEKPVAVDPVGIRSIIASSELAQKKGLAIVAGTQRRHHARYIELMKRIHTGDIGQIVAAQGYWNDGGWNGPTGKPADMSDMEWQIRHWIHFTWLSGDQIVEQHVHNIDVINWALRSHPVQVMAMGGRETRGGEGNIFDHMAVEFEYPNGVRVLSMCRQMAGCTNRISERVVGTKGVAFLDGRIEGSNAYEYKGESRDPYIQEHTDLIASIRNGEPLNEGRQVAESTMAAVMGRMSAYTGRALQWDWAMNASELDLSPPKYELGDLPVRPIAVPGKTRLI